MTKSTLCQINDVSVVYPKSRRKGSGDPVVALDSVNLKIELGQRIGIIGLNGAGKTTLLKILAGILPPTSGEVKIFTEISPILNSNLGLDMRLSGQDNVISRLMLQGHSKNKAKKTVETIADWTELHSRILDPISTYSAGMRARLAFALNTESNSGLLLIDEGINAGDASFQIKAKERLNSFLGHATSLVIASHSFSYLNDFANSIILMDKGSILEMGNNYEMFQSYKKLIDEKENK
jgi:ABC-type polysaccharide/polyol phosphate transport system ATPase subunit